MTYTLADAIRAEFERTHPNGKDTLLCVGLCRRRKDREDFRETPWHGRAAACRRCEGSSWLQLRYEEQLWKLEQEREKVRMLRRHVARQRFRLLLATAPRTADVLQAYEQPYYDAVERAQRRYTAAFASLPWDEMPRPKKRARLTKENTR
ncbi:hypothetical protein M2271_003567 [Streptomyces sp. LBL]|uniref:hypothetical protein n=1 Tax=Streptomyces sp. LBL TaxID=2940562 RepID=UPI0024735C69|nr:hypothetical protein [Streptomyces sp. LBL]MDH6625756.1 hypothetical protein [Streptomyces sp. LBL]